MPFGEIGKGEFGTYYIGYSRTTRDVTERMLRNMFIGDPPGNTDRILDFSTAVTGSLFFTPDRRLPRRPAAAAGFGAEDRPPTATVVTRRPVRRLTGIGSLKGHPQ